MPLILVARGGRDPRAVQTTWNLATRVAATRPGLRVKTAFLRHEVPSLRAALAKEAALAHPATVVVPLLLSDGHYARRIVPEEIRLALGGDLPLTVALAEVLGPVAGASSDRSALELIVAGLARRLAAASDIPAGRHVPRLNGRQMSQPGLDGIVLIGAASRASRAMDNLALVAQALSVSVGLPCRPAYVSTAGPGVRDAFDSFRRRGAEQIAAVPYLLGPGVLYDRLIDDVMRCGAAVIATPLGDSPELVELILHRADAALAARS